MDWRETVANVSEKVFPGLMLKNSRKGNEVLSNLPLQMALYFNAVFFPVWLLIIMNYLIFEFLCLNDILKFTLTTILASIFGVEAVRLYLGYEGNLRDKISELATFWLLSLLLQLPLESILIINPYFRWKVAEIVAHIIMYFMLLIEIVTGYIALRNISRHHAQLHRKSKRRNEETEKSKTIEAENEEFKEMAEAIEEPKSRDAENEESRTSDEIKQLNTKDEEIEEAKTSDEETEENSNKSG